jgi:hypothetical protein
MRDTKILLRDVVPLFWKGLWGVKSFWGFFFIAFGADIYAMRRTSTCQGKATREIIGWFFGNGSGVQDLSWLQLAYCIFAAILGYIFLGVTLFIIVRAFQMASRASQ